MTRAPSTRPDEMIDNDSGEVLPVLASSVRQDVDIQVATAKQYPRSIRRFKEKALAMATLDEETATSCFYALPRGGEPIEGPSARLAEICASAWGNIRVDAKTTHEDEEFVYAEAVAWDLETNSAIRFETRRRITDRNGRRYKSDMIGVTANAACSIALRNAIFKVVPMAYVRPIYLAARKVSIGDAKTLAATRATMVEYFGKMGVQPAQVCAAVNKESVEDITLDDIAILKGTATSIADGDTTVDAAFPAIPKPGQATMPATEGKQGFGFKKDKDAKTAPKADEPPPSDEPAPPTE